MELENAKQAGKLIDKMNYLTQEIQRLSSAKTSKSLNVEIDYFPGGRDRESVSFYIEDRECIEIVLQNILTFKRKELDEIENTLKTL